MKNRFSIAMSLAVILAMLLASLAMASSVDESIVDATTPDGSVTLNPGGGGAITINLNVAGKQESTATFDVYRDWTLSGGTFTGSNPQTFTVSPRAAGDPVTTFSTSGSITVASGQAAGTFTLAVGAFNITNVGGPAKLSPGASSNYEVTVEIPTPTDTAAPNISCTPPSDSVWYGSDVSVPCTALDSESGLANAADANFSLSTNVAAGTETTTAQTNSHQVCDNAGNCDTAGPYTFMVDKKAPTISAAISVGTPGLNGWYISNVTAHFTCSDAGSGIADGACPADQILSTEGAAVSSAAQTVTDAAGNTSDLSNVVTVKIDKTGPSAVLAASGTSGDNGWFIDDVTITTSGSDAISDNVTCSSSQSQTAETTGTAFNGSCTNDAGLTTNAAPLTVKLDKTGPSASLSAAGTLGDNGWYVSNVTVSTAGSDSISSPVSCTPNQSQTSDTTGQTFNGSCTNDAGLTTNAAPLTIKRDATPPALAPSVSPNPVILYSSATASPNATDVTSGVASSSCGAVDTSSVGSHTVNCTATDNAGNTNSASASYSVIYAWSGFFQPIDNNGVFNVVNAGRTIPVKFSLGGDQGLAILAAGSPSSTVVACPASAPLDTIEETTTTTSGLRYDPVANQYIYNWKTLTSYAGTCRQLTVKLADGTTHTALFKFTR
jgi:hypothetical protein